MTIEHGDIATSRIQGWVRDDTTTAHALRLLYWSNLRNITQDTNGSLFLRLLAFIADCGGNIEQSQRWFVNAYFQSLPPEAQRTLNALSLAINTVAVQSEGRSKRVKMPTENDVKLYLNSIEHDADLGGSKAPPDVEEALRHVVKKYFPKAS